MPELVAEVMGTPGEGDGSCEGGVCWCEGEVEEDGGDRAEEAAATAAADMWPRPDMAEAEAAPEAMKGMDICPIWP